MHNPKPTGTMIQAHYKLQRVLGQGGSGITYEAEDCFTGLKAIASSCGASCWVGNSAVTAILQI
ncbi:MAG: hypothetical protein ACFB0C_24630 [Leptolyngbyaceae cyanobacterium]